MSFRDQHHKRPASSSTDSTPKKRAAADVITLAISDDNKGAMGFRFAKHLTKIVDLLKAFKIKGCKVTNWHKQFKWWGIVQFESEVRSAPLALPLFLIFVHAGIGPSPLVA